MGFITELPLSNGCTNLLMITDRLSKDLVLIPMANIEATSIAKVFIKKVVAYHWLPDSIVSDRGLQFVGDFWKELCRLLRINRRVSTAFHLETDGAMERINSTVEQVLRAFVNWDQDNWVDLYPVVQAAIRGRPSASTKVSPFFLQHGYEMDLLQFKPEEMADAIYQPSWNPTQAAQALISKPKQAVDFAQSTMAEAQQLQEEQANKHQKEALLLKEGDKVWLQYGKHLSGGHPNKKLDWKNGKYTVVKVQSPGVVVLDTLEGVNPKFLMDRLHLAPSNPL